MPHLPTHVRSLSLTEMEGALQETGEEKIVLSMASSGVKQFSEQRGMRFDFIPLSLKDSKDIEGRCVSCFQGINEHFDPVIASLQCMKVARELSKELSFMYLLKMLIPRFEQRELIFVHHLSPCMRTPDPQMRPACPSAHLMRYATIALKVQVCSGRFHALCGGYVAHDLPPQETVYVQSLFQEGMSNLQQRHGKSLLGEALNRERRDACGTLIMLIPCQLRVCETKVRGKLMQGVTREALIRIEDITLLTGKIDHTPARRGIVGSCFESLLDAVLGTRRSQKA